METPQSWTYLLVALGGLTAVTFLTRASFFLLPSSVRLPPRVERALRYAPACALAAIVAPSVLTDATGALDVAWGNHQLWAVLVATAVFTLRRNMLLMMSVGMSVFTVLRLFA